MVDIAATQVSRDMGTLALSETTAKPPLLPALPRSPARPPGTSADALISDLIGQIYDCAIDPRNWETTLASINRELDFHSSVIGLLPLRPGPQIVNVSSGFDADWLAVADEDVYRASSVELWGGAERVNHYPLDEPIVHSQGIGSALKKGNRYFTDILEPRRITDAIALAVSREPTLVGYAAFNRHSSAGAITDREVSTLRLLGPHFRRATTISNLFDLKTIEAATFRSAIETLSVGAIIVGEDLDIVHANAAAEALLNEGSLFTSDQGTFVLRAKAGASALKTAVQRAAQGGASMGQVGIGIPAGALEGSPCVIHVFPLERDLIRRGLVQRAVAALFIAPAAAQPRFPTDALATVYDLTPAESRIFELISEGLSPEEIASDIGVAKSTVRTHLLRVFEKTGCKRQADLVQLAAKLAAPG